MAEGLGFAVEFQGDGTPHAHGFVSLVNAWQYGSLEDIATIISDNWRKMSPEEVLHRFTNFMEHMSREDHFNHEEHTKNLDSLEQQFHSNNEGPKEDIF